MPVGIPVGIGNWRFSSRPLGIGKSGRPGMLKGKPDGRAGMLRCGRPVGMGKPVGMDRPVGAGAPVGASVG